jgi:hypothetical protein
MIIFKINNDRGFSLTDLLSGAILISLIGLGFSLAMLQYLIGYQETRDYVSLQNRMLYVFDVLRHGYVNEQNSRMTDPILIGLLTAQNVDTRQPNQIRISPVDGDVSSPRRWSIVGLNTTTGEVFVTAQWGHLHTRGNERIFPSRSHPVNESVDRLARANKYQITELTFTQVSPFLVHIKMTGRVRFRERRMRTGMGFRRPQSVEDDLRLNVRYAQFETTVFLGNADK